ncbi:hypothetical protein [Neorhizobium sp. T6_25]|uniref:hypothetical protein n=1 Tax=Neorhizobium sp. T6_25 TaxID=2093833 RepID=UPI00155E2BE9|nr:hypothetical protein [Neorhizobium sp. T6_25]
MTFFHESYLTLRVCSMKTEIVTSRKKTILLLLGSLVFVAVSWSLPDERFYLRLFGVALFSANAIIFVLMLVRPSRLSLDQDGLSLSGGFRLSPMKIAWRDVEGFVVRRAQPGTSLIGFNYSVHASSKPRGAAFSRGSTGVDGGLPGGWSMSDIALVDMLNAYREQALANDETLRLPENFPRPIPASRRSPTCHPDRATP